jgi:hypothetical protein
MAFALFSTFVKGGHSLCWYSTKGTVQNVQSPHEKIGYYLSMSQQAVSADIIQNSAVGIFSPKTEGTKT